MTTLLKIIFLTILMYLVQKEFRRGSKWISWGTFLIAPLLLTPYWLTTNHGVGIFPWVKLYTIIFSVCWVTGLRFSTLSHQKCLLYGVLFLFIANIFEAIVQDVSGGHWTHYLVVFSGILMIATLPDPFHAIEIDPIGRHDLYYNGMTRAWIIEYTAWNWAFVYLNFPAIAGQQIAVLGTPLIIGLVSPRRWLQARAFTLAAYLIVLATFTEDIIGWMDTSHWVTPLRENLIATLCLGIVGTCAVRIWVKHGQHFQSLFNKPQR